MAISFSPIRAGRGLMDFILAKPPNEQIDIQNLQSQLESSKARVLEISRKLNHLMRLHEARLFELSSAGHGNSKAEKEYKDFVEYRKRLSKHLDSVSSDEVAKEQRELEKSFKKQMEAQTESLRKTYAWSEKDVHALRAQYESQIHELKNQLNEVISQFSDALQSKHDLLWQLHKLKHGGDSSSSSLSGVKKDIAALEIEKDISIGKLKIIKADFEKLREKLTHERKKKREYAKEVKEMKKENSKLREEIELKAPKAPPAYSGITTEEKIYDAPASVENSDAPLKEMIDVSELAKNTPKEEKESTKPSKAPKLPLHAAQVSFPAPEKRDEHLADVVTKEPIEKPMKQDFIVETKLSPEEKQLPVPVSSEASSEHLIPRPPSKEEMQRIVSNLKASYSGPHDKKPQLKPIPPYNPANIPDVHVNGEENIGDIFGSSIAGASSNVKKDTQQ